MVLMHGHEAMECYPLTWLLTAAGRIFGLLAGFLIMLERGGGFALARSLKR